MNTLWLNWPGSTKEAKLLREVFAMRKLRTDCPRKSFFMEAMCKLVVVQHRLPPMTKYQDLLESLMKNNKVTDHVINDLGENVDKTVLKTDLRVVKKEIWQNQSWKV